MDIVGLIIQLISGAVGGNIAGAILKKFSLGPIWNSVIGILGGGLGGYILSLLGVAPAGGGIDAASIVKDIAGGGVGGGVLLAIIGIIVKALKKT